MYILSHRIYCIEEKDLNAKLGLFTIPGRIHDGSGKGVFYIIYTRVKYLSNFFIQNAVNKYLDKFLPTFVRLPQ